MVQALLAGRKTQTRRILKLKKIDASKVGEIHPDGSGKGWIAWQPGNGVTAEMTKDAYPGNQGFACPYGHVGDILWVRESFKPRAFASTPLDGYDYKADHDMWLKKNGQQFVKRSGCERREFWKPSIHMPKAACRIWLEITDIRVERVQDISEEDAIAEGAQGNGDWSYTPSDDFENIWKKINGTESWEADPFCWVISFKILSTTGKPSDL